MIAAKDFGAHDKNVSLAKAMEAWTQVSIPEIKVTNGNCQVAIISDANAGNWIEVDDLSLIDSEALKIAQSGPAPAKQGE